MLDWEEGGLAPPSLTRMFVVYGSGRRRLLLSADTAQSERRWEIMGKPHAAPILMGWSSCKLLGHLNRFNMPETDIG